MTDTDKYEIPKYEDAKKVVQDAGLIEENDGHPDIFYRKIAQLLAEVKRLREAIEKMAIGMDEDWRHWRIELLKLIGKDWKEMIE